MKKDYRFSIIKPPIRIKFKKFCKNIYKRYNKYYISYSNNKPFFKYPFINGIDCE